MITDPDDSFLLCDDENILGGENFDFDFGNSGGVRVNDNFTTLLDGMSGTEDSLSRAGSWESKQSHSFDDGGFLAQNCEDYLDSYMEDELKYKLDMGGIEKNQGEIKWKMRAILYDWISEVCTDYMFNRDTYHSAIKIVDLFLMRFASVKKSEFQ